MAFLLLGSNLGDRVSFLNNAALQLQFKGVNIIQRSQVYETEPWGVTNQQSYLNQVLQIKTKSTAIALLDLVLGIEKELGRERREKWDSRTIDIDILYFNDEIIDIDRLKIPHPFLEKRKFVLVPLNEIAPNYLHPILKKKNQELLFLCPDPLLVSEYTTI